MGAGISVSGVRINVWELGSGLMCGSWDQASGVRISVWELGSVRRESGLMCGSWDQCVGSQD